MMLTNVSTARLIQELLARGASEYSRWDEPDPVDLTIKLTSMVGDPLFLTLPEPYQRLILELKDELQATHRTLDSIEAVASDPATHTGIPVADRLLKWVESHPDRNLAYTNLLDEVEDLKQIIDSKGYWVEFWHGVSDKKEASLVKASQDYQALLTASQHLAKQSTGAHEAMDAIGVPVCGLSVEDRMKCLTKMHRESLAEKDKELEACRQTMVRLAHEAKHRFLDGK